MFQEFYHWLLACMALNAWYLDDGTLIGSPNDLLSAPERVGPGIGLHWNKAKYLLYIPADANESLPKAIPIVREGFSLLGCPVGLPDFCEATFQTRVDKIKLSLGLLHTLKDSQAQTTLLRSCLASGVGTVERLGGPLWSKMLAPEAILHKIKHVTVKLIMRLLIVGGPGPPCSKVGEATGPPAPPVPTPLLALPKVVSVLRDCPPGRIGTTAQDFDSSEYPLSESHCCMYLFLAS